MAVSSLLFKGVPSPLNLKILAACVVRDSSVENEAYLDTYLPANPDLAGCKEGVASTAASQPIRGEPEEASANSND
jgi:hypothetical protein